METSSDARPDSSKRLDRDHGDTVPEITLRDVYAKLIDLEGKMAGKAIDLLTPNEVYLQYGITPQRLKKAIKAKKLPHEGQRLPGEGRRQVLPREAFGCRARVPGEPVRRSTALQIALYRDSSKRAAEWAREKGRQLAARVEPEAPAPAYGYLILAVLLLTGAMAVAAVFVP
jgi:hypothetical protein